MISKFRIGALVIILNFFASVTTTWGQDNISLLQMAVPSLNIAPDARGGGMGDMGAATLPDINSQYWNAAKYASSPVHTGLPCGQSVRLCDHHKR